MIIFKDLFRISWLKLKVKRKRLAFAVSGVATGIALLAMAATFAYSSRLMMIEEEQSSLLSLQIIEVRGNYLDNTIKGSVSDTDDEQIDEQKLNSKELHQKQYSQLQELVKPALVSGEKQILLDFWLNDKEREAYKKTITGKINKKNPVLIYKDKITDIYNIICYEKDFFSAISQIKQDNWQSDAIPIILSQEYYAHQLLKVPPMQKLPEVPIGQIITLQLEPGYIGDKPLDLPSKELKMQIVGQREYGGITMPEENLTLIRDWVIAETNKNIPTALQKGLSWPSLDNDLNFFYVLAPSIDELEGLVDKLHTAGYNTSSYLDILERVNELFLFVKYALSTAGAVIIVIIVLGLMNIIGKMINDSQKEIGIFKTLGAANKIIRRIFIIQAAIISGIGTVVGLIAGYIGAPLAVFLFMSFMGRMVDDVKVSLSSEYGSIFQLALQFAHFPAWYFLIIFLANILICTLVAYGRAQKAAKLDPIQALKDE